MLAVRVHGRGGQGSVTAARILVNAALKEGLYGQTIPQFGGERRGAPVKVSLRLDSGYIPVRNHVYKPDLILVFDASLFEITDVMEGIKKGGILVVNTAHADKIQYDMDNLTLFTVDATRLAKEGLGTPIVNTAMLGAFCRASNFISVDSVKEVVKEWFHEEDNGKNTRLVQKAYDESKEENIEKQ